VSGRQAGFVGLGNMGGRMTRRLTGAGITVIGYDVRDGQAAAAGAVPAGSAAAVCAGSECVLLSLPDSTVVERVVFGDGASGAGGSGGAGGPGRGGGGGGGAGGGGGLLAAASPGQVIIDLSTAAPASTRRIHAALAERGVEYLDAGISGGAAAAEKGTLTIMVGGSAAALAAVRWVFEPIAAKVVLMGDSGAGHSTKLLNNFLNAVSLAATAEVMVAARKAGLDLAAVLDVINASSGVNYATTNRFPHIIKGDYLEGGLTSALMTKDVVLYVDHVRELGVPCLNAAGPLAAFGAACNLGYADQISNRVVDAIGDLAGGIRLYSPGPPPGDSPGPPPGASQAAE
jgi:3-hydroxyisobutyrate dehydrogenase